MSIIVTCPSCKTSKNAPDEVAGKRVKCPACGDIFDVLAESDLPLRPHPDTTIPAEDDVDTPNGEGKSRCPSCSEYVQPGASVCPHCHQAIFSANKEKNAAIGCIVSVVLFILLWIFIRGCAEWETDRLMEKTAKEVDEMMKRYGP